MSLVARCTKKLVASPAFNHLWKERVVRRIKAVDPNIAAFMKGFLQPNKFQISGRMTDGTPQGSSLSPVLFVVGIALGYHNENAGDS
ncbi:hypothetical protein BDZ91DRAFT_722165 [Kalaharituber pfeilii]|nr:hypothetical protein BDZ91DRAFT_722165 [Kalaharituber pfeilii]